MKEQEKASLAKSKLVTADILGQATAMGVRLNEEDSEVRDRLMKEVLDSAEQAEPSLENPIDVDEIPDEALEPGERVERNVRGEAEDKFLEPEIPEDIKEELEAPDFEQMAQDELDDQRYAAAPESEPSHRYEDISYNMVQGEDDWEELDQDVLEERKRRIAAEKKAEYYENLRLRSEQKRWAAEARKYFPLSGSALDSGHIKAKSRKDFLRQAKKAHETVLPYIKDAMAERDRVLEDEKRQVREETKAEFIRAWGRATTGPSGYPARADDYAEELADSRRKGDLARSIGILRKRAEAQGREDING